MRAFIVTCMLGLALAAPQGYNYQTGNNNLQLPGIPGLPGIPNIAVNLQQQQQQVASADEQRLVQQALQAPRVQQLLSTQQTQSIYQPQQQQQRIFQQHGSNLNYNLPAQAQSYNSAAPVVSKDIYVHVPPTEELEERYPQPVLPVGPPRKHYRIVFIKAPTPSVSKAAVRVQQAPVEEKTIIYVLTKKPDPLELQTAIEEAAPKPISKPEVFFIKYKTQEEAAHAQRTIQAQYDQLGGTTQVSDEGVAPVTSVIGALDSQRSVNNGNGLSSKYLPANLRA